MPIVCGDLKEAITIFDRETLTIDISSTAEKLWETYQTGIKVRERLDIQSVDEEAVIMAEHTITTTAPTAYNEGTPVDENKTYTEAQVNAMNKADILALGTRLGYTMTTTDTNTKAEIVADFMEQQAAAQA
ncbi:MAG: phage major capsid protein [[Ruminococcus] torques]